MDVFEAVRTLLAVRRYQDKPVPSDVGRRIVVIPFGYPAEPVGRGKKQRKPLGEVASRNRYGERSR